MDESKITKKFIAKLRFKIMFLAVFKQQYWMFTEKYSRNWSNKTLDKKYAFQIAKVWEHFSGDHLSTSFLSVWSYL